MSFLIIDHSLFLERLSTAAAFFSVAAFSSANFAISFWISGAGVLAAVSNTAVFSGQYGGISSICWMTLRLKLPLSSQQQNMITVLCIHVRCNAVLLDVRRFHVPTCNAKDLSLP